jgi:sec-independent protein translocase protein TatC
MSLEDQKRDAPASNEADSSDEIRPDDTAGRDVSSGTVPEDPPEANTSVEPSYAPDQNAIPYTAAVEENYGAYEDPYAYNPHADSPTESALTETKTETPPPPAPPAPPSATEDEPDEEGMLRMSFLEHLEELRSRLLYAVAGLGVAFVLSLTFSNELWRIVQEPAAAALKSLGYENTGLVYTSPMEGFTIIWVKLPLLTAIFMASPWLLYQAWAFIAPGLYKKERRLAAPFILCSAGLFILGGLFAYFVAFRFGLTFLLGIGRDLNVMPMVTITSYFDIFVNVILGIAVVFELPVLIFFLTLLRVASPRFLLRNSRYAVLGIVLLAAVVTPTPDIINLMLFSVPMVLLYFIGVFASYLLVLSRENRRFPWKTFLLAVALPLLLIIAGIAFAMVRLGYKLVPAWPFLTR